MAEVTNDQKPIAGIYSWYVVGLLAISNAISFADRGFINLAIDPIKRDLRVTDTQMALLMGPAFVLFYSTVSLPLGRIADRSNRKYLVLAGILFWSFCTALFGLAGSFTVLLIARMGVGLGEAALVPAGVSMLGDLLPSDKLSRAVSIFTGGGILGGSLAAALGGMLLAGLTGVRGSGHLLWGVFMPWQAAFLVISIPGLLVGLIILVTLAEPRRMDAQRAGRQGPSLLQTAAYLWTRRGGTLMPLLGFATISAASGVSIWMATFYIRTFHLPVAEVGAVMGTTSIIVGFPAAVLGGYFADLLRGRGREDANLIVALCALAIEIPLSILILSMSTPLVCFVLAVPTSFALIMAFSVAHSAVALSVPSQMRGQAVALYLLLANSIGIGIVPLIVALLTDKLFGDPALLRYSMMLATVSFMPFSLLFLSLSRKAYRKQVQNL